METHPDISIVIATYCRAETLVRTLRHLAEQDLDPARFEVIVVDDASPDNTPDVVESLAPELPFELTFFRNEQNRGPGFTQNRGIQAARAATLMIMTDDVFMTPTAVRMHLEFHREHPELEAAALGKVLQSPELNQSALMRKWDPFRFWVLERCSELPFYMFWACNVSCKRDFMREHGMFREHRGRAGAVAFEDLEVGYRLSQAGMKLHYLPDAMAYHYHIYTLEQAIDRWYMRGMNYEEFRQHVPAPELTVYFHILNLRTFREYMSVLKGPNEFRGREKSIAWHIFRHGVRCILLNRITAPLIWSPLLRSAESVPLIERLVTRQMYRAFFYYHFLRGVHDSYRAYDD